jgi:hypothetical protein
MYTMCLGHTVGLLCKHAHAAQHGHHAVMWVHAQMTGCFCMGASVVEVWDAAPGVPACHGLWWCVGAGWLVGWLQCATWRHGHGELKEEGSSESGKGRCTQVKASHCAARRELSNAPKIDRIGVHLTPQASLQSHTPPMWHHGMHHHQSPGTAASSTPSPSSTAAQLYSWQVRVTAWGSGCLNLRVCTGIPALPGTCDGPSDCAPSVSLSHVI